VLPEDYERTDFDRKFCKAHPDGSRVLLVARAATLGARTITSF
jgi:hypothetical protein